MSTPIPKKDLSYIKNSQDLKAEIIRLKIGVKLQEQELKQRWKKAPQEALKITLGSVVPFLLIKGVPMRTWGVVRNAVGLFSSLRSQGKGNVKEGILNSAKKIGINTALKAAFNIFKNRKQKLKHS